MTKIILPEILKIIEKEKYLPIPIIPYADYIEESNDKTGIKEKIYNDLEKSLNRK